MTANVSQLCAVAGYEKQAFANINKTLIEKQI